MLLRDISGRQWLAYDLEERRAIAFAYRDRWVAKEQGLPKETAEYLIAQFQRLDQEIREYECGDQPPKDCDRDKAMQADLLTTLCRLANADECTDAGVSSAAIAQAELQLQESIDQNNCAFQIENLDRAAGILSVPRLVPPIRKGPIWNTFWDLALESCGWRPPPHYF
jgi:hypothetical protein